MNAHVAAYMDKARDALRLARLASESGLADGAVNRAYYAAFYAASAALLEHNETPRTHTGVHNRFRTLFVQTGRVPTTVGKVLPYAYDMRQKADYDAFSVFDVRAADDLIAEVETFVQAVDALLTSPPGNTEPS